jgi:plastocyanin
MGMKSSIKLLVAALVVAACGGGDVTVTTAISTTTTAEPTTTTTVPPTTVPPTTTTTLVSIGYGDDEEEVDDDPETTTTGPDATTTTAQATTTTVPPAGSQTVTIGAENFAFSPSTVTIKVGDTVQWVINDGSHTSTSGANSTPDGAWNQVIAADAPVSVTFDQAGQYRFFCRFHPDAMQGTVVVEP